jgi:hypothetical protein
MNRKISFFIIFLIILLPPIVLGKGNKLEILGLNFPTPIINADSAPIAELNGLGAKYWLDSGVQLPHAGHIITEDILIGLSQEGNVVLILPSSERWKPFVDIVLPSLVRMKFTPPIIEGKPIPFMLAAELIFYISKNRTNVVLRLPFIDDMNLYTKELIEKSLELNGFKLPQPIAIAPYYSNIKPTVNVTDYDFAIFLLTLDTSGGAEQIYEYCSSNHDISKLFKNAILYSKFTPAAYKGENIPSSLFLIVRYFPYLEYPTKNWPLPDSIQSAYPYEFLRIEPALYLDSIIHPAIPLNIPNGIIQWGSHISFVDSLVVGVVIDTLGKIISHNYYTPTWDEKKNITDTLLSRLHFFPAREIDNSKANFGGEMVIRYEPGRNIRIEAKWISPLAQPECRLRD